MPPVDPKLVEAVLAAWTDPMPKPHVHWPRVEELRSRWPELAGALDALALSASG